MNAPNSHNLYSKTIPLSDRNAPANSKHFPEFLAPISRVPFDLRRFPARRCSNLHLVAHAKTPQKPQKCIARQPSECAAHSLPYTLPAKMIFRQQTRIN